MPLTQTEFAERVGVARETVARWFKDSRGVRDDNVTRIANALGLPRKVVKEHLNLSRPRIAA